MDIICRSEWLDFELKTKDDYNPEVISLGGDKWVHVREKGSLPLCGHSKHCMLRNRYCLPSITLIPFFSRVIESQTCIWSSSYPIIKTFPTFLKAEFVHCSKCGKEMSVGVMCKGASLKGGGANVFLVVSLYSAPQLSPL